MLGQICWCYYKIHQGTVFEILCIKGINIDHIKHSAFRAVNVADCAHRTRNSSWPIDVWTNWQLVTDVRALSMSSSSVTCRWRRDAAGRRRRWWRPWCPCGGRVDGGTAATGPWLVGRARTETVPSSSLRPHHTTRPLRSDVRQSADINRALSHSRHGRFLPYAYYYFRKKIFFVLKCQPTSSSPLRLLYGYSTLVPLLSYRSWLFQFWTLCVLSHRLGLRHNIHLWLIRTRVLLI